MKIQGIIILKRASSWNYLLPWEESEWETVVHSPGHMGSTWSVPCNLGLGSPDVQDWFHAPIGRPRLLQTLSCAFCIAQGGRRTHSLCVGLGGSCGCSEQTDINNWHLYGICVQPVHTGRDLTAWVWILAPPLAHYNVGTYLTSCAPVPSENKDLKKN